MSVPILGQAAFDWARPLVEDVIKERYRDQASDKEHTLQSIKLWKSPSSKGPLQRWIWGSTLDVDFPFQTPRSESKRHVKLIVTFSKESNAIIALARLFDWFGPEKVEIGHWEGILEGIGDKKCSIKDRPVPSPKPPIKR